MALLEHPADLALLDKTNPPLGGVELYRRLRERSAMPIVFVSGWAEELEAGGIGADGYVGLPLSRKALLRAVAYALEPRS